MNTTITPQRDNLNKKLIMNDLKSALGLGLTGEQQWLISDAATPSERAAYVKKQHKLLLLTIIIAAFIVAILSLIPHAPEPVYPAPKISMAGMIQSIQLHETAFSTSTTVVTSTGIYQVRGGVSAKGGDVATLKKESHPREKSSLCIESNIKTSCYELL